MFDVLNQGPRLTGQETLEESDRIILKNVVQDLEMINVFNRVISQAVEYACNQNDLTQKSCKAIVETTEMLLDLGEKNLYEPFIEEIKHASSLLLSTPKIWMQKYGIPEERTLQAMNGAVFCIPLIGRLKVVNASKVGSIRAATVRFFKEDGGGILLPKKPATLSTKKAIKLAKSIGYKEVKGEGNGSHTKMKMAGAPTLIIPLRSDLSPLVVNNLWKSFGEALKKAPLIAVPFLANRGNATDVSAFDYLQERKFLGLLNDSDLISEFTIRTDYALPTKNPLFSIVPRSVSRPVALTAPFDQTAFTWNDIEIAAQKIVDVTFDFTGVTPVLDQAKGLKNIFTTILSNPENAPKLMINHLLKEPEKLFQKIVASPDEFLANSDAFLADPTLTGALNIVGTVFSVIAVANEVLPILTKVSRELFKNPLKTPVVLSKELLNLTTGKIVGLVKTVEGLFFKPVDTLKQLGKELVKSPKNLLKNVKDFCRIGKSKHKKAKKAKRKAEKLQALQLATQKRLEAENQQMRNEVVQALPSCYRLARQQWVIPETALPQDYLFAIVTDWKLACGTRKFSGSCGLFIRKIDSMLMQGSLLEVAGLSPTAHSPFPIPPKVFFNSLVQYAKSTLNLAIEVKIYRQSVEDLQTTVAKLSTSITTLKNQQPSFESAVRAVENGPSLKQSVQTFQQINASLKKETDLLKSNTPKLAPKLDISPGLANDLLDLL